MSSVNTSVRKKDAVALVTGKPVYTGDIAPKDCLIVKLLRSPHAHAEILSIDPSKAEKLPGVVCVLTHKDMPHTRFTLAGQTFPEPSPYDRLILENRVRFVGDPVAIVAAEREEIAQKALKLIRVHYKPLPFNLDPEKALDNPAVVHPEADWKGEAWIQGDPSRNLCASGHEEYGDMAAAEARCAHVVERVYHTLSNQQAMTEPFTAFCQMDCFGRLNVVSSTQIPFHVRRILARALEIPAARIRVSKPRIGGGFGAKQTAVMEMYPAVVTLKTGRPAKLTFTRHECQTCSSPRHEMVIRVRLGADASGVIRFVEMHTLSNTGAFGEHGPTTVGLSGEKSISLYRHLDAFRFDFHVVYTNTMSAGAYRGYGAPQGLFALESAVDELASLLGMDPMALRLANITQEGAFMPSYNHGSTNTSCALDACIRRAAELFAWKDKPSRRVLPNGHIRGKGMALAMQGSGIAGIDVANATVKLDENGYINLMIGATDMGTGCDTILSQIAADCLGVDVECVYVSPVDTDFSPYDCGSYASSTTYVTGMAVVRACQALLTKIQDAGAHMLGCPAQRAVLEGGRVSDDETGKSVSLEEIGKAGAGGALYDLQATGSRMSEISPPPFMAGMAEVDIDPETGEITVPQYVAAVDCGTVINPMLARVQVEGGIVQGIGMALTENVSYAPNGSVRSNSFLQYKIPTRMDVGEIQVAFESSYEQEGPFGAKSIGEIVISTPAPAIANAVFAATGLRFCRLPIRPCDIAMGILQDSRK